MSASSGHRPSAPLKVFIGWEARQDEAYLVARRSLERRSSIALDIRPLVQADLRAAGFYGRPPDADASTEFTLTRFLVPYLARGDALALYFDCDFLWLDDVARMVDGIAPGKGVHCVQHDHRPVERVKMDGRAQAGYPRKNWSSLMLFAPRHPACRALTPAVVDAASPAHLHRMAWIADDAIGALDPRWNWLEGVSPPGEALPGAVHYTRGGPWLAGWEAVAHADLWRAERAAVARQPARSD